ncbi:hypothetical protein D1816_08405 [Aquimarina sp. AD10]|uniref:hypothetical protein n=1 Tax=Aquimarina sp. AD10 TaxID=1714849 RepID=UPI000E54A3CF|nr:hypothetical protein [Aquimarina sp. AD10]AXT60371.1 hypothetical protein D1816_08405 [Aquimarina sp. AD10]RKN01195.1 hypothetical protein D7033_05075 [Aquimarina sp. AD10]
MDIKINDKKFPKEDLIKLIAKSKLQTIVHIRSITNIGLKDAKEIIENLEKNPDYYDNSVIKIIEREFIEGEKITFDFKNTKRQKSKSNIEKKVNSHIIKNENSNKIWTYIIGIIFMIALLYFFIE